MNKKTDGSFRSRWRKRSRCVCLVLCCFLWIGSLVPGGRVYSLDLSHQDKSYSPMVQEVQSIEALENIVTAAEQDTVITLGSDFPTQLTNEIKLQRVVDPNKEALAKKIITITIDGKGKDKEAAILQSVLEHRHITIDNATSAKIILTNLVLEGKGIKDDVGYVGAESFISGGIRAVNGYTILNNVKITKVYNHGALYVSGQTNTYLEVLESEFISNSSITGGGAIYAGLAPQAIKIKNSVFEKNQSFSENYEGGAVFYSGKAGPNTNQTTKTNLRIEDSLFKNNRSSGRGGAVGVNDFSGDIIISNTYFWGNQTRILGEQQVNGGAVSLQIKPNSENKIQINKSTFAENETAHSGGALYLDLPTEGINAEINHSTFYKNKALGLGTLAQDKGGGGVFVMGGGSLAVNHSTFALNQSSSQEKEGALGAGLTSFQFYNMNQEAIDRLLEQWKQQGDPVLPLVFNYSIILDNQVLNDKGEIVSSFQSNVSVPLETVTLLPELRETFNMAIGSENNLGIDNGLKIDIKGEEVFWESPATLKIFDPQNKVGSKKATNKDYFIARPVIMIKPNDQENIFGLADNVLDTSPSFLNGENMDLRYEVSSYFSNNPSDLGAVELYWVAYHANGGAWQNLSQLSLAGFYSDKIASIYFQFYSYPQDMKILTRENLGTPENKVFAGWNTQPDGSGQSYNGEETYLLTHTLSLYAQWKEAEPRAEGTIEAATEKAENSAPAVAGVVPSNSNHIPPSSILIENNLVSTNSSID